MRQDKRQQKAMKRSRVPLSRRFFGLFLVLLIGLSLYACSLGADEEEGGIAQYGEDGARFARKLAQLCPSRTPYSPQEEKAANFIMEELGSYGYQPEKQVFTLVDEEGNRRTSANIIAHLKGGGFSLSTKLSDEDKEGLPAEENDLIMILGAHYDTPALAFPWDDNETEDPPGEEDEEGEVTNLYPDGIHDNASGVAALLTAARIMREENPGYDVAFVYFGAGNASYQGARSYLSSLSAQERKQVDVMVNIGPIYAGDKVYAHAGQNSVRSGEYKDYAKRRKLYQVTDIFFDNQLNSRNKYAIYTNQASFFVETDTGARAVFREWTSKLSDHTPFDRAGIPVVFMESGDYRVKDMDEVKIESRNPFFQETGGVISGSRFDRTEVLEELFRQMDEQTARQTIPAIDRDDPQRDTQTTDSEEEDASNIIVPRLTLRINNTAFVLVQLARKGPLHYDFNE